VRCPYAGRREQYGAVFVGQLYGREERVFRRGNGGNALDGVEKLLQLSPLLKLLQISAGFFGRVESEVISLAPASLQSLLLRPASGR
jgi:hypothetical protein